MTRDQKIRALVKVTGMPERRATAIIDNQQQTAPVVEVVAPLSLPFAFTLPWSALISDNRKYSPASRKGGAGRIILTAGYREAKAKVRAIAREALTQGAKPLSLPLSLHARVWVPDNRPGHDVANFAKCCHDALTDVVYSDDQWLYRVVWERAGVDVDHPRAEVTITQHSAFANPERNPLTRYPNV